MRQASEIFGVFLRLGLTSFGGPIAHLGYFREEFVARRRWLSEEAYAELIALCQFLPGPASSQVGFAIGLQRGGPLGALAAWIGFTAPSAFLMVGAAYGLSLSQGAIGEAVIHGLKLVAVAIVAHAVWTMAGALVRGPAAAGLAIAALIAVLAMPGAVWSAAAAIAIAGLIGVTARVSATRDTSATPSLPRLPMHSLALFALFLALLALLPFAAQAGPLAQIADGFYRAGALVFGGGHVVLPLLQAESAAHGWADARSFLAGYGAAQILPGPLFAFSAYLGALAGGPAAASIAIVFIFLPGFLLVAATLPIWSAMRASLRFSGFVAGANAAVVGVLGAAFINPVIISAVTGWADALMAALGFVALVWLRAPMWCVALGLASGGAALALLGAPL